MALMQQGSKGPMRDLDYVNPRQKCPPSALPPEIRRKLGLGGGSKARGSSEPPPEVYEEVYTGAANAEPKVGKSGAGTNWQNPRGHAFVRRGSGIPMSERASRKAQLGNAGPSLVGAGPKPSRGRPSSREGCALPPLAPGRPPASAESSSRPPKGRKSLSRDPSAQRVASRDRYLSPKQGGGGASLRAHSLPPVGM